MIEKATLADVERDGEALILADGRRLRVRPDDTEVVCIWFPDAILTLAKGKDRAFDMNVTNEETGETIKATMTVS